MLLWWLQPLSNQPTNQLIHHSTHPQIIPFMPVNITSWHFHNLSFSCKPFYIWWCVFFSMLTFDNYFNQIFSKNVRIHRQRVFRIVKYIRSTFSAPWERVLDAKNTNSLWGTPFLYLTEFDFPSNCRRHRSSTLLSHHQIYFKLWQNLANIFDNERYSRRVSNFCRERAIQNVWR